MQCFAKDSETALLLRQ